MAFLAFLCAFLFVISALASPILALILLIIYLRKPEDEYQEIRKRSNLTYYGNLLMWSVGSLLVSGVSCSALLFGGRI